MNNPLDKYIDTLGGYDKLSEEEKRIYRSQLEVIQGKSLTIEDLKTFIRNMISAIELSLSDTKEGSHNSRHLKARLKNALVIEAYLFSPERAKKALEDQYRERIV